MNTSRRTFIWTSLASATGFSALSMFPPEIFSRDLYNTSNPEEVILKPEKRPAPANSIRFSVIGLNPHRMNPSTRPDWLATWSEGRTFFLGTDMSQEHCFLATWLMLTAQKKAITIAPFDS